MSETLSSALLHMGVVTLGTMALMTALWFVQRRIRDAGVVDVGWSAAIGLAGVYAAIALDGDPARRALVGAIAGVWGIRLAWRLLRDRVLRGEEDGRYQALRSAWGERFDTRLCWFYQGQAVSVGLLSLPFVLGAEDGSAFPAWHDWAAGALWIVGVIGEGIADAQLARFKRSADQRGKTCRQGLWAYSRHPNYFFTWLVWCAFGAAALGAPWGWIGLSAPAVMLLLMLRVTGIPPTERRALESRPESYRAYQREVSAFFPLPPKRSRPNTGAQP